MFRILTLCRLSSITSRHRTVPCCLVPTITIPFSKTFDAYVPVPIDGQEYVKLAKVEPDYVPLTDSPPRPLHTVTEFTSLDSRYCIMGFCQRRPAFPNMEELVRRWYHCAILHDRGARPPRKCDESFEIHGGFIVYEHLQRADPPLVAVQMRLL